ncbi:hypothetical protein OG562_40465 [Streptomyces sp. NBC_01275]|uniref:hypothetical protein n=1 Tax=Streptomyces sp. NBC_01275 TaxID=2903807 RepID=UPI00224D14A0|nr:hypothetical protein [Streptomyces sp. NBC_01275]MCX4767138.1 hypothetical protein [Streptomyces sp. NBC_01275]
MSSVEASLRRLLEVPGVTGVSLIDAVTGLTYGEAGAGGLDPVECSRIVGLVGDGLCTAGAQGELESVVITGTTRQLVVASIARSGDPLLLAAVLERSQTNLALVLHHVGLYAEGVAA